MAEKQVTMTHPKLPGREIRVRESAVRSRERAGWKRARASTPATAVTTKKES